MASHLSRRVAISCAIASLLGHSVAHASASASASIGPVTYTLTDLDPNDGIAPSLTWGSGQVTQSMWVNPSDGVAEGGGPNAIDHFEKSTTGAAPVISKSMNYQGFSVAASPEGLNTSASIPVGATWGQTDVLSQDFVLSPNTAITFTAEASSALGVVVPPGSVVLKPAGYLSNGYFDWAPIQARALASLYLGSNALASLSSTSPSCSQGCLANDSVFSYMRSYASDTQSKSRQLSVSFSNSTPEVLRSTLSSIAVSDGYATAPLALAVPEVSTVAQMSLGLMGLIAVRRSKSGRTLRGA
jgi:hypothetical protein